MPPRIVGPAFLVCVRGGGRISAKCLQQHGRLAPRVAHGETFLFGALGVIYWFTLFMFGHTLDKLLIAMPLTAGLACLTMFIGWYLSLRHRHPVPS